MPRIDAPCSGCGKMLAAGPGSLPTGERMCQPCRRAQVHAAACAVCGSAFVKAKRSETRTTCSRTCAMAAARAARVVICDDCPRTARRGRLCDPCRVLRRSAANRRKNTKRRGVPVVGLRLTIADLARRDGWRCHLCRRRIDPAVKSPDPMSPSVDHLTPISRGGIDEPSNLALAHRICNVRRGNRGFAQLLLVG